MSSSYYILQQGKTFKAIRALDKADGYFSLHEDEETLIRLEVLDFTSQVLRFQKKQLQWFLYGLIAFLALLLALAVMVFVFRRTKREKENTEIVLQETIEELRPVAGVTKREVPKLTDRELQILRLIADGKTNPQIAEAIFLSPETIKWYRKKLLVKFDAINSADLIRLAMEMKLL